MSKGAGDFKLTYATMFDPPEELHARYEAALARTRAALGREHAMIIGGREVRAAAKLQDRTPIDREQVLGLFSQGDAEHGRQAVAEARKAFGHWSRTPWRERVALLRRAASLIDERVYDFGAAISLEVGKNRTEALGDAAETADLIRHACDAMEVHDGFVTPMGRDPIPGFDVRNVSVMRPHGVWVVISPFNFPCALTGGPVGATLVAGNTVVFKPASKTPWTGRLIAEALRDAGLPEGAFNYVTGPGDTLGRQLIEDPGIDGITFTGSVDVGMGISRAFAGGKWPRPAILELGGKNACIVSRHADLDRATVGIVRSAFGLQGQKCSAASRLYVEAPLYDELLERLVAATRKLTIGDPTVRGTFLGPVINAAASADFQRHAAELARAGRVLTGGHVLADGDLARGWYCEPTLVDRLPADHPLWRHEMFLPILMIARVASVDEGLALANDSSYGLTAGFYGDAAEAETFFDRIEAGVTYANRPQGATTGAWPGFQPFGGWKGSGSTGRSNGGPWYLVQYMHEQSRTVVM
jgi:1-pyrroline-5-carboxylate dehydrogenase